MRLTRLSKRTFILFSVFCIVSLFVLWKSYSAIFGSNVTTDNAETEIFISEKSTVEEVAFLLTQSGVLDNEQSFLWVATLKKFKMPSKGGRYLIRNGWSNNDIINTLRVGSEIPVDLTFNNIRTPQELSARLAEQLALDSVEVMKCFNDYDFIRSLGFDFETIIAVFIPNTYEVYWSIEPTELFKRMKREYDAYWTKERLRLAQRAGYKPAEIITLASIVDEETQSSKERSRIAGVYINRLDRGIPLQADPTLKFALQDFTIRRLLNKHKKIDSPYNTYKYKGLPPGPIRIPSPKTIDAVLNFEKHSYIYFCAKDDFSGEHAFAKTLREHNNNARRYHRALNNRKIYK